MVFECLKAAYILQDHGVHAMVINCHTVKPLDHSTILGAAKKCKKIITVEEGQITGGLGGAIAEFLAEHHPTPIRRIGIRDHYGESGEPTQLLQKFGLSASNIVKTALHMIQNG